MGLPVRAGASATYHNNNHAYGDGGAKHTLPRRAGKWSITWDEIALSPKLYLAWKRQGLEAPLKAGGTHPSSPPSSNHPGPPPSPRVSRSPRLWKNAVAYAIIVAGVVACEAGYAWP
ncbi:hypothetical protein BO79DRAFT_255175 [Aspergillus costaricaensis CBS 115574]|uniref:Uncharacterized protein n=1 Tax=Aspergillus costaricaensis CBS 115574 TaxID=1448317 RepID=A0ACD1IE53_9EURO|nr:hypothetical protein BO79DRAFT_255175 [Aspergillus costaricaensis CBS 115574]RAK88512.1 hypothetical protein BO79DRAFT_255175 [Aspergillus costaricaensis CBS 115574]